MTWPQARTFLVSTPAPLDVLLASAAGNPGAPAAGAAPVTWPQARTFLVRSPDVRLEVIKAAFEVVHDGICLPYAGDGYRLHMSDICRRVYANCINFQEW